MNSLEFLRTYAPKKELIRKSFYMFDLNTFDGRLSLLKALPILDQEIVKQAYAHIFPNYDTEELDPKRARAEIRGVLVQLLKEAPSDEAETLDV